MANADESKATFENDPSNQRAFEHLEAHYFQAGRWNDLATLYEHRLSAPEFSQDGQRAIPILFRLAQLCEERCLTVDRAIENYWKVARIDPNYRPALRQLRLIYTRREQWDMVLQIAEMEAALPMEVHEQADFHADLGKVWEGQLNEPSEALSQYQAALERVPDHIAALKGLASVHSSLGHHDRAAASWERLAGRLRGLDRAPVMVALGSILRGHLDQTDRAMTCFEQALRDDPRCADAIEAMIVIAAAREDWPLVAHLNDRRFDIASGAQRRAAISVEAGMLALERLDDIQAARMWFERALEMVDDDVTVFEAIAELERHTGNRDALLTALTHAIKLRGNDTATSTLLEAAELHSEGGQEEKAVELLLRARDRSPGDALVAESLSDGLARLGRTDELVEILEQRAAMAHIEPQAEAELLAEIGRIHLEDLHDPEAAAANFARAFAIDPQQPGVSGHLEAIYRKAEDWNALRSMLEIAAREGAPARRPHAHAALGEVLERHFDDREAAVEAFEAAIELDSGCEPALTAVTRIVHASGDPDAMLRVSLREAEVTRDRQRLAQLVDEVVPLLEERGRGEEALHWVERLWELVPGDRNVLAEVIRLREELERYAATIDPLERLEAILSGDAQAANRRKLASVHQRCGDAASAIRWWEAALERQPGDVESLRALDVLYESTGDHEALARTIRRLADTRPEAERSAELQRLASLLSDRLDDVDGAIVVLWQLVKGPETSRPEGADDRLEELLQRAGRFEELSQRWLERRRDLEAGDERARALDLKRAHLYLDDLGQFDRAAEIFRALWTRDETDEEASAGLERALRIGNDTEGLVTFLEESAAREGSPRKRAEMDLERAGLLEESLGAFDEAGELLRELAARSELDELAHHAGERLERLLERSGEWDALRESLESRIDRADEPARLALHEELALLCRDRLNDREGCVAHLEAAGELAPDRESIWHALSLLYSELDRPTDQLRVIEHELELDVDRERKTMLHALAARLAGNTPDASGRQGHHYERLLELEPGHPEASEFLIGLYEREDRPTDIVRLLTARLDAALTLEASDTTRPSHILSLRLRIAGLQTQRLEDHEAAARTLEPAVDEIGPRAEVSRPLADIYRRLARTTELIALCERTALACDDAIERASWNLELADQLRHDGANERAAEAYARVCEDRPEDRAAQSALLELHRELDRAEPLAEGLEREIARRSARDALPLRLELASLLDRRLDRTADSLAEFAAILAEDPRHSEAFLQSLDISRRLADAQKTRELLHHGLEHASAPSDRANLLEQIGELERGPLEDVQGALGHFREALGLDPSRASVREGLIEILSSLGRHQELLDVLFLEAQRHQGEERCAVYERAIEIARTEISADAALPWLERLHSERPDDAETLRRIASIHRQAGRPEALLRALELQLELEPGDTARHALYCDVAGVLERDLDSPGRAAFALEAAHAIDSSDPEVLADLDRLYDALGRYVDRARIIEERIANEATGEQLLPILHRGAARLCQAYLGTPHTAVRHLLHSLNLASQDDDDRVDLLRHLQQALHACGRLDGWARAAESELDWLEGRGDSAYDDRRCELHFALAESYERELARPARALRHWLGLIDDWNGAALSQDRLERAETGLLDHLRAQGNVVELERRLLMRLERLGGDAAEWLECASLQHRRLFMPTAARAAYREALERDDESLEAIRGLRETAKSLRDWSGVAESIDRELALSTAPDDETRCELLRELAWTAREKLPGDDGIERATAACHALLEHRPDDFESMRALQEIAEAGGDWDEALARYEQEVDRHGDGEGDRRQEIWLRIAEIARDRIADRDRAIAAFGCADEIGELDLARTREWAELYREAEDWGHFCEVFARWCDAEGSPAGCSELLELSGILEDQRRDAEAGQRAEAAVEAEPERAEAYERAARLCEKQGEAARAAGHYAAAAEHRDVKQAVEHLLNASRLVCGEDPPRAADHLRDALDRDASCAEAHARLAVVCETLEAHNEGVGAAGRALDLGTGFDSISDDLLLEAAAAGARAALALEQKEGATRLFSAVLHFDSENVEALEELGELFYASRDLRRAREVLEKRHALEAEARDDDTKRGRRFLIIAESYEADGEADRALESFEVALENIAELDDAHAGVVRIHEARHEKQETLEALDRWIAVQANDRARAEALVRAADIDREAARNDAAIERLREASEADPANAAAWTRLAAGLLEQGDKEAALEAATAGLAVIDEDDRENISTLAWVRGTTLETTGEASDAIAAYVQAVENDSTRAQAALGHARLLCGRSEWANACEVLESFTTAHPRPNEPTLAQVFYERGQLLAGPLEDVEAAIACYEQAVELDPEFTQAITPLANLLSYMPERWDEAVRQHSALLREDPAREHSIRALAKVASGRNDVAAANEAKAILRALGVHVHRRRC